MPVNKMPSTAPVAASVLAEFQDDVAEDFPMCSVLSEGVRISLQASERGFAVWEQHFIDPESVPTQAFTSKRDEVAKALFEEHSTSVPVLQILFGSNPLISQGAHWPMTVLSQAVVAGRMVIIGKGFESVDRSAYWLAIATVDQPSVLLAYQVDSDKLLNAFANGDSVFLSALQHSEQALNAVCDLDAKLARLLEAHHIASATAPGAVTSVAARL